MVFSSNRKNLSRNGMSHIQSWPNLPHGCLHSPSLFCWFWWRYYWHLKSRASLVKILKVIIDEGSCQPPKVVMDEGSCRSVHLQVTWWYSTTVIMYLEIILPVYRILYWAYIKNYQNKNNLRMYKLTEVLWSQQEKVQRQMSSTSFSLL